MVTWLLLSRIIIKGELEQSMKIAFHRTVFGVSESKSKCGPEKVLLKLCDFVIPVSSAEQVGNYHGGCQSAYASGWGSQRRKRIDGYMGLNPTSSVTKHKIDPVFPFKSLLLALSKAKIRPLCSPGL